MTVEPSVAMAQQLLDLRVAHPVVLVIIQYGEQDIQVREQLSQRGFGVDGQREVVPIAELGNRFVERMGLKSNFVAKRLKEPGEECRPTA